MGHMVYVRSKKKLPHESGWWDEKKKLEVVTTYLALGNRNEASRVCNVPIATVKSWSMQPWWQELITSIQSGEGQRSDNKMSKVIDKALDLIVDRLEQGDYQYDQKTGRLVKVPLKARDLERVASGLFDKRQLIRKQPTNIKTSDIGQADMLVKLAQQFATMAGQKLPEERLINEYIEGEFEHDNNTDI